MEGRCEKSHPGPRPDSPVCRDCSGRSRIFSAVVNVLMLTAPLYMLQVYDRVIPSRSHETLLALTILIAVLFVIMGILDYVRARVAARIGATVQARLDSRVFRAGLRRAVLASERSTPGLGAQGPRGGAAAGRLAGALRRLRHALGAGLPHRDLQLPSAARAPRARGHAPPGRWRRSSTRSSPSGTRRRRRSPPCRATTSPRRSASRARWCRRSACRARCSTAGRSCAGRRSTRSSPRATGSASSRP